MASKLALSSDDLECAVCSETLNKPKLLSCSHTFCELCINTWIEKSKTKSGIECPLCRKITAPPKTGLDPAFWATCLPDFISEKGSEKIVCQPCKSSLETREATVYCLDCKEYLCSLCHVSHTKLKVSKLHKTIDVGTTGDKIVSSYIEYSKLLMCPTHPEKEIEFFCEDDSTIFCSTCAFLHHRSCDTVSEIKSDYDEIEAVKPLSAVSSRLQKLRRKVEEATKTLRKNDDKFKNEEMNINTVLKETKLIVTRSFERVQDQISKQMKEKNKQIKRSNDDKLKEYEEMISHLEKVDKTTKDIMEMTISRPDYVIASRKLEERYDVLKDQVQQLDLRQGTFYHYTFEFKKDFLKSLGRVETFGSFKEERMDFLVPTMVEPTDLSMTFVPSTSRQVTSQNSGRQKLYCSSACYLVDDRDKRVVVADRNNKRLVVIPKNEREKLITKLGSQPYMIASTKNSIYVSFPNEKRIRKYDTRSAFKLTFEMSTRRQCYAIDCISKYEDENLLASLFDGENWELVKYGVDGNEIECLSEDFDGQAFKSLWHFRVYKDTVYQSCQEDNLVKAFDLVTTNHEFTYKHDDLKCPGGIDIDMEENIYVCGISSYNIHVITRQGQQTRIVNLKEVSVPTNIAFSDNGEDLVVLGNANNPGPFFYQLE